MATAETTTRAAMTRSAMRVRLFIGSGSLNTRFSGRDQESHLVSKSGTEPLKRAGTDAVVDACQSRNCWQDYSRSLNKSLPPSTSIASMRKGSWSFLDSLVACGRGRRRRVAETTSRECSTRRWGLFSCFRVHPTIEADIFRFRCCGSRVLCFLSRPKICGRPLTTIIANSSAFPLSAL